MTLTPPSHPLVAARTPSFKEVAPKKIGTHQDNILDPDTKANIEVCSRFAFSATEITQRQKYRSMKQNRKPRDKSTYLQTPYLQQKRQEYTMEKRQPL